MEWHIIPTGRVWVDPGGAFGLVPRALWVNYQTPNEDQLIPMDLNSLLVFDEGKTIVIDTGIGHKLDKKGLLLWGLEWPEGTLLENLAQHGVSPEDVDIVIDTHLHSDHCGGNTFLDGEQAVPTFPRATYLVQQREWEDAANTNVRTRATYLPENLLPVREAGQFELLNGDTQITENLRTVVTRGHTPAHQSVILEGGERPVFFVSDLASYAVHFAKTAWVTAYDVEPLETIATKEVWQPWAVENDALIVFQHDCTTRTASLVKTERGYKLEDVQPGSIKT
jgi:glyoxylase-like metal-dependent hydrolase (beta-lactamase superfamily II)